LVPSSVQAALHRRGGRQQRADDKCECGQPIHDPALGLQTRGEVADPPARDGAEPQRHDREPGADRRGERPQGGAEVALAERLQELLELVDEVRRPHAPQRLPDHGQDDEQGQPDQAEGGEQ
jgi:hypothetical protein